MLSVAVNLEIDSSFNTLFPEGGEHLRLQEIVSHEFGSTDQVYILYTLDDEIADKTRLQDIRDPEVFASIDRLKVSLLDEPSVDSVFSINDLFYAEYGKLPESLEESKEFLQGLSVAYDPFIAKDFSAANLVVNINIQDKQGALQKAQAIIERKIAEASVPVGVEVVLTGDPPLINRIMNLLITDNLKTVVFAIVAIVVLLSFFFRSVPLSIITTSSVVVSLIWLAGTMHIFGMRLTMMTAAVGAMMVGMGIDYAIHVTHSFLEKKSLRGMFKEIQGALVASALTTIAGFIAMLFATGPSSKTQGAVLSFGILYAFLSAVLFLPTLLSIYKKLAKAQLDELFVRQEGSHETSFFKPLLYKLSVVQVKRPLFVIGIFFVMLVLIVPGMSLLRFDTSNDNWIPDDDPVYEAIQEVSLKFGGLESQSFLVFIDTENFDSLEITDLRDPVFLRSLEEIDASLTQLEFVDSVSTPVDSLPKPIPQNIHTIKELVDKYPNVRSFYNADYSLLRFRVQSDSLGEGDERIVYYKEMLHEIESVGLPRGIVIVGQGGIASDIELDETLQSDTGKTTMLGFIFVFIIALLLYRSFVVGFMAFLPIIFSLVMTIGIMGYIDLPFTVLTSGMLAIVMGIGIDFSIHLIHSIRLHLREHDDILKAVNTALLGTGQAISLSTFTTITGFISLSLATLLATRRLGFTLAIAIVMCYIACIVLVPSALTLAHKFRRRKKK